jgi:ABC-type amino acid transport substrate-binding protein
MRGLTALAAGAALLLVGAQLAHAADALTVCLDEDIPLYSRHKGAEGEGFVVAVSRAIAERLGRPLKIQWFETKIDPDDSSVLGANALLSDGRCELVGGYPLVRDALGKPGIPTARMPDFEGAKPADRRRRVALGTLIPSRAYQYAPLVLVVSRKAAEKPITGLGDLKGIKLGAEAATLGDAILMLYERGVLVDQITHLVPGRGELLPHLERGDYDAAIVDLRSFDAYRAEHPDTRIKSSGYYYRIGFNMGFVGLSTAAPLIEKVNAAIEELLAKNKIAPLAEAVGLTYLPPHQPEILEHLTLRELGQE